jgi:Domain of unknown function (DUF397)
MNEMVRGKAAGDGTDKSDHEWRKSSRSYGSGQCIEIAESSGAEIAVRDSKNVRGAILTFSSTQWNAFVAGVRRGDFVS